MLRGLKTFSLTSNALKVKNLAGHALLHVSRGSAEGSLAVTIEHSDNGTSNWADAQAVTLAPTSGTLANAATATAEIDMDKFKAHIRLKSTSVGTVTLVAQGRN